MTKKRTIIVVGVVALLGAGLWTCNGDDDNGGGPVEEPFIITGITIAGTATEETDDDGADDQAWSVAMELDGGARPNSLAADDGGDVTVTMDVRGTSVASGEVSRVRVQVTLHD